jgi:hypothetical protein
MSIARFAKQKTQVARFSTRKILGVLAAFGLVCSSNAIHAAIKIDGVIDEAEWSTAHVFDQFVVTQPFTLVQPDYPTEARLLSTAAGIAVAFEVSQPHGVLRQRAQSARDSDNPGDRVNFIIDFNADGVTAYDFTVSLSNSVQDGTLTQENQYSADWDGDWQHAVHEEEDRWTVEMLIPWSTAAMKDSAAQQRTVAVLFDRVLGHNGQRSASAPENFSQARFVSNFPHVQINQFADAQFNVFPYVSLLSDLVDAKTQAKVGIDLLWKPSGDFQLAAAVNPDFGQVESDQLVVNFDAIETFFSDKRPFFTQNQGFFDLTTPNGGQLIYTRRIGAARDDGNGVANIDGAVKFNGSAHGFSYGALGAVESNYADDLGRVFYAQRLTYPVGRTTLGYVGTYVDRPFLSRTAAVNGFDFNWRRDENLSVEGQVVQANVQRDGDSSHDGLQWLRLDFTPSGQWRHQFEVSHFGQNLELNDLGFLPRANLNRLRTENGYNQVDFAADSPLQSVQWLLQTRFEYNDQGERLPAEIALNFQGTLRNGDGAGFYVIPRTAGIDDLISRGHGPVRIPARTRLQAFWNTPRRGDWLFFTTAVFNGEGLGKPVFSGVAQATWFASDEFTIDASIVPRIGHDWLLWRRDDIFAQFDRKQISTSLNLNWLPAAQHELRAKIQWFVIDASNPRPLQLDTTGHLRASNAAVAPFSVANFGLQIRYRWQFAPQSDFYAVYSRGGFDFDNSDQRDMGLVDLLSSATGLRDSDQFLLKMSYRF